MKTHPTYSELKPSEDLVNLVHSFWMHCNLSDVSETRAIVPDSFFKIIIQVQDHRITKYFITGLWSKQKNISIPPNSSVYGCRLRVLAPEYLLKREVASLLNGFETLDVSFLKASSFDLTDFTKLVEQWETELRNNLLSVEIQTHKLRLSQLIYRLNGDVSATEVSEQVFWTNRQINRYFNKWLGISLKMYLNIQKCYESYIQIREGQFQPRNNYFDQAHFIKEVKKHTGETPSSLHKQQNDRFIQLKHINGK